MSSHVSRRGFLSAAAASAFVARSVHAGPAGVAGPTAEDTFADVGPTWVTDTHSTLVETATAGTFELSSAALVVGDNQDIPADSRNVLYCKLWTPARALYWVLTQN